MTEIVDRYKIELYKYALVANILIVLKGVVIMKINRLASLILSVSLSLSYLGLSPLSNYRINPISTANAAEFIDGGKCGDNVSWTLDSDGTLTISGTGKMYNYIEVDTTTNTYPQSPWEENSKYIIKRKSEYEEIQELFKYYCVALSALAYGYTCLNQSHLIDNLIISCKNVFEHKNLQALKPYESLIIESEYSELDFDKIWYSCPAKYESELLSTNKLLNFDNEVIIEFKGEDILEVISNEKE